MQALNQFEARTQIKRKKWRDQQLKYSGNEKKNAITL